MIRFVLIALLVSLSIGCTVVRETQPVRTATEQFILSHAVIDAARQIEADAVAGKKVMLDLSMLKTVDVEFAHGELRDRLLQLGAFLRSGHRQIRNHAWHPRHPHSCSRRGHF